MEGREEGKRKKYNKWKKGCPFKDSNLLQAFYPPMKLVYLQNVPGLNVSAYFLHWG